MLSPGMSLAAILVLSVLLAIVSAVAGALWWRVRSLPLVEAVLLARALASKRRALEDLLDRIAQSGPVPPKTPSPPPPRNQPPRVDPPSSAIPGPRLIAVPDLSVPPSPTTVEPDDRYADLIGLAEAGASAEEIARETGRPIGHVELILNLGRKPSGASSTRGRS